MRLAAVELLSEWAERAFVRSFVLVVLVRWTSGQSVSQRERK